MGMGLKFILLEPNLRLRFCRLLLRHKNVKLKWIPNYCKVSSYRNNIIKLTHYDETEKRAHDSQIVRAKENSSYATVGPATAKHQVFVNEDRGAQWFSGRVFDSIFDSR